jgi:hypothetical protein
MQICVPSFLLKNVLLHEKKPDIGNGVEYSAQKNCLECSTQRPSTQYFRPILQVIYHLPIDGELAVVKARSRFGLPTQIWHHRTEDIHLIAAVTRSRAHPHRHSPYPPDADQEASPVGLAVHEVPP